MSEPPKCQDCGKWVIGPGHEDECPAPSECRCPRDYDSQGDHHPDCPLNKPAPAAQPNDLVRRLRDPNASRVYGLAGSRTCLEAAAAIVALEGRVAELERERDDFYMDYRMRCDEQTKHLHVALEQAQERFMALCKTVADGMPLAPTMVIPADGWNAIVQQRAERAEAEVQRITQERDGNDKGWRICEADNAKLREVVAAADAMREQFRPNTVNLMVHEYDAARAAVGEA